MLQRTARFHFGALRAARPQLGSKAMLPGGSMTEGHYYGDLTPDDHDLKGFHMKGTKQYLDDGRTSKGPGTLYHYRMRMGAVGVDIWGSPSSFTDSAVMDHRYALNYKQLVCNVALYPLAHLCVWCGGCCALLIISEIALCPDNQIVRRQERYHAKPDCFRLHSYAIPYFNHRMRNTVRKYRWTMIQNEPDWADKCHSGLRPDGVQGNSLFWVRNPLNYTSFKYYAQCPLSTSLSTINYERIHHDMGYKMDGSRKEKPCLGSRPVQSTQRWRVTGKMAQPKERMSRDETRKQSDTSRLCIMAQLPVICSKVMN
eukprot:GSA25T00005641001.1